MNQEMNWMSLAVFYPKLAFVSSLDEMYTCYPFPIEANIVHGRNRPWLFVNIHQNKHNSATIVQDFKFRIAQPAVKLKKRKPSEDGH